MVESNAEQFPFLSIIIPVYNDNKGLSRLLPSLKQQTYPGDKYEIIVVDNGSSENVQAVTDTFEDIILFYENNIQSSYAARNKG
ncbi:MAG: glycosyltransferase family 2 protein, partial [Planctomycetota bacterium]